MPIVTLPPRLVGENIRWDFAFRDANGSDIDLTSGSVALAIEISNAADPALNPSATLSATPSVAPQAHYTLTSGNWSTLNLTADAVLRVTATATTSGGSVYKDEFFQPLDYPAASNAATVDIDEVAKEVYRLPRSSLTSAQKLTLDRAVVDASQRVNNYAKHYLFASSVLPDEWRDWARLEAVFALSRSVRPERLSELKVARDEAMEAAFNATTYLGPDSGAVPSSSITLMDVRRHCIAHCVRMRPRLWIEPLTIDQACHRAMNTLWNIRRWNFKKRTVQIVVTPITITGGTWVNSTKVLTATSFTGYGTHIDGSVLRVTGGTSVAKGDYIVTATNGSTTLTLASSLSVTAGNLTTGDIAGTLVTTQVYGLRSDETFGRVGLTKLYIDDGNGVATWAGPDSIEGLKARAIDESGFPRLFRYQNFGSRMSWHWWPLPDAAYTFRAEVNLDGPTLPSTATATTAFDLFPDEFRPFIRELTLANLLASYRPSEFANLPRDAMNRAKSELIMFEDNGPVDDNGRHNDVYGDFVQTYDPGATLWPSFGA